MVKIFRLVLLCCWRIMKLLFWLLQVICQCPLEEDDIDDFVGDELVIGNFRLPVGISEDLLNSMIKYHLLTDHTLQIFNSHHTNLQNVTLTHMVTKEHSTVLCASVFFAYNVPTACVNIFQVT